ncbi:tetratricopeptide repeat protein [Streptomyces sp. HSW2009]|uniref:tetratricopeptide repeat protein n=1 Tax=Streptomyces sp. HSW2009 TaxID=3142890 RepID=UPI0032EF31E5
MPSSPHSSPDDLLFLLLTHSLDEHSPAWRELAITVAMARTEDDVLPLLNLSRTAPQQRRSACQQLAEKLRQMCAHDALLAGAVTAWMRRHGRPRADPEGAATVNEIGGSSVIRGPAIQARDIHGDLHFHLPPTDEAQHRTRQRQLPPISPLFVGREADLRTLDRLRDASSPHGPRLVVTGLPGVGKTTLVVRWLLQQTGRFPDGHLYADLAGDRPDGPEGIGSPDAVTERFLLALGVRRIPSDAVQRTALWRSVTADLRLALVLDNARTAAQVRPLLLTSSTGTTVITSRSALTGLQVDGALVHRLPALATDAAVELLAVRLAARVAEEPVAAREVVTLCGHLPLALCVVSAQLDPRPHRSLSSLAGTLAQGHGAIDQLHVDGEATMRIALDSSYDLLADESASLYRRMGLLPTDRYDLFLLAAVAGRGQEQGAIHLLDLAVQGLVEANLVEEVGPDTYRFHDLVRSHARLLGEEREAGGAQEEVLHRFVEWCLCTAASAEAILTPSHRLAGHDVRPTGVNPTPLAGPAEALEWLDTYRHALMEAIRHCARVGWDSSCWRLADVAWPLFQRLRPTEMWTEAYRLGLDAARRSGSRAGEGRMLSSGAIALRDAGRYEEATGWYEQALDLALADGDARQQAQALNGLGHLHLLAGRFDDARAHLERALAIRESIGYERGAALSLRRLGEVALHSGDLAAAADHLQRASDRLGAMNEVYEATRAQALLGHVLVRSGDQAEGARRLRLALARFRSGNSRSEHWEGNCLEWLGLAAQARGAREAAAEHYRAAAEVFRRPDPGAAARLEDRLRHL